MWWWPLPLSQALVLFLCLLPILAVVFVLFVLPRIVSRIVSVGAGCTVSVGKISLLAWGCPAVENVVMSRGDFEVRIERVSIRRNDFTANSYFTLKAERARVTRWATGQQATKEEIGEAPPPKPAKAPPNYEVIVSKMIALLAVVSFNVEELIFETELQLGSGDSGGDAGGQRQRRKLLCVTRLGQLVLLSPSATQVSPPPPPASSSSPQPEGLSSQPQPSSAKCLVKQFRQTFCVSDDYVTSAAQANPDVDFSLPHTTHVDASVRDGIKIELSDGGFVALNSFDVMAVLLQEFGAARRKRSEPAVASTPSPAAASETTFGGLRKSSNAAALPSIKVVSSMFFIRSQVAEVKVTAMIASYHGQHDASISVRCIESHCLATGELVFSAKSLKAEKLQDCAEFTYEDLVGRLNGAVIVLFGKMEPYHENLDFELRICSGSARKRFEGTEITILQTRLYGLGEREIFSTEAFSMESAESLSMAHCVIRMCAVRPGQRDIELLLQSVRHISERARYII